MIGWLEGKFIQEIQNGLLMQAGHVGYIVFASTKTLQSIPRDGSLFSLYIETHVREDHIHLYGFKSPQEQDLFKTLLSVQGVGAKVGIAILSALAEHQIREAIISSDKALLTQADGVGPKLANRIILELKDKLSLGAPLQGLTEQTPSSANQPSQPIEGSNLQADAVSALENLGYGRADGYRAVIDSVKEMNNDGNAPDLGRLIQLALKRLAH
ncbi:MAG: Holliday junction branch migration protein RuvA [Alphaproteobacteria bacterium]